MAMWWQCEATCAHELVHHHLFLKFTNLFWNSTFWHTHPSGIIDYQSLLADRVSKWKSYLCGSIATNFCHRSFLGDRTARTIPAKIAFSCKCCRFRFFLSSHCRRRHFSLLKYPALTQLYITLCHSLTLVVHHCVTVQSCQLTSSNHQPVPAKTGTAAHSGGEEGLVEGWVVGISILLAGAVFAGKQSGILCTHSFPTHMEQYAAASQAFSHFEKSNRSLLSLVEHNVHCILCISPKWHFNPQM